MAKTRIGIWLVGARGGVATTSIVGLIALKKGLVGTAGLVSQLQQFQHLALSDWKNFIVSGHEIRNVSLVDEAERLADDNRAIDPKLLAKCRSELKRIDQRIRPGTLQKAGRTITALASKEVPRGESPRQAIDRLQQDLIDFVRAEKLQHVIVVNVASTEPPVDTTAIPKSWDALEPLLEKPRKCPLPASSLYAIAALELGHSYVNFTPSLGSTPAAIDELARLHATRHAGCDGTTG
ncbi:MAG: inositol-3-phosphate synthase, partial [Thermoguttaceae bacterium]